MVADVGQQRPLLGLFAVDAQELGLGAQGDVVGALVLGLAPGVVAAALHLRQLVELAVNVDDALALGVVLRVVVHGGDGAQALVDLDEDGPHRLGALPAGDGEAGGPAVQGEAVGLVLAGGRDRQRAALIAHAVHCAGQTALPGEAAFCRIHVAGKIEVIVRGFDQADLGRQTVVRRRGHDQRGGQRRFCGQRRCRQQRQQQTQRQKNAEDPLFHKVRLHFLRRLRTACFYDASVVFEFGSVWE